MSKTIQGEKKGKPGFEFTQPPRKDGALDTGALDKAVGTINAEPRIDCINCGRCTDDCPLDLRIPDLIGLYNDYLLQKTLTNLDDRYMQLTGDTGKAGDCAGCRVCEGSCRNNIKIAETIEKIATLFEEKV